MKPKQKILHGNNAKVDPNSHLHSPLEALIPEKNTSIPEANDGTKIWESKHSPHQSK